MTSHMPTWAAGCVWALLAVGCGHSGGKGGADSAVSVQTSVQRARGFVPVGSLAKDDRSVTLALSVWPPVAAEMAGVVRLL